MAAHELHNYAGHALNTILVQAGPHRVLRERDSERSAQAVGTIEELARETVEEIDRIVGLLREDREMDRSPLPGIDQIPALVERQRAGGLDVHLTIDGRARPAATHAGLASRRTGSRRSPSPTRAATAPARRRSRSSSARTRSS